MKKINVVICCLISGILGAFIWHLFINNKRTDSSLHVNWNQKSIDGLVLPYRSSGSGDGFNITVYGSMNALSMGKFHAKIKPSNMNSRFYENDDKYYGINLKWDNDSIICIGEYYKSDKSYKLTTLVLEHTNGLYINIPIDSHLQDLTNPQITTMLKNMRVKEYQVKEFIKALQFAESDIIKTIST